MALSYTWDEIETIVQHPHLLGHLAGKTLLTPMHDDWIKYIWNTTEDRSLQAHRGSYKTTAIAEIGVPLWLAFHPDDRIAIVRKSYTAAADVVRAIGNIMESPMVRPFFNKVWGKNWKFTTKRDGRLNLSVKTSATVESSIEALGLDTNVVGRHYGRALFDDVIDINDRVSDAEREKTILMLQEWRANIIDRGCPTSFIGTPWHKKDGWTVLPSARKFPIDSTGLVSDEERAKIKSKTTPILYACNYELKFEAEDDLVFKEPRIGQWYGPDVLTKIKAHVDAAFDGDHYNALTILGQLPNGRLNAVGWVYPGNIKEWMPFIMKKLVQYNCRQFYMEDNADKGYSADILKSHPDLKSAGVWVDTYHEKMNKHIKINTYLYEAWKNIEFAEETDPQYIEMITDYREKQEPDDSCFAAGTMIMTDKGNVPIEEIRAGDKVLTPFGFDTVVDAGCTGWKKVINKFGLTATPDHKIYDSTTNSFIGLDSLTTFNRCVTLSLKELIQWKLKRLLSLMEGHILEAGRQGIIFVSQQMRNESIVRSCIGLFGNFLINSQFLKGIMFITKMVTQIIMTLLIWNWLKLRNILVNIQQSLCKIHIINKEQLKIWPELITWLKHGTLLKKGISGIYNTLKIPLQRFGLLKNKEFVKCAEMSTLPVSKDRNSVLICVPEENIQDMDSLLLKRASFVEENTQLHQDNLIHDIVQANVKIRQIGSMVNNDQCQKVYNLTVGAGCYFANGILVSNCDSLASLIREGKYSVTRDFSYLNVWNW